MHPAFVICVAVFVLLYLVWFVYGLGTTYTFEKKFLATDIALTIDSLLAARNNVVLYYLPQRADFVPRFNYSFQRNEVVIFEGSMSEKNAGRYFFTSDPSVSMEDVSLKFSEPFVLPRFALLGNDLLIDDAHNPKYSFNLYLLPRPSAKIDAAEITLDPGHGYSSDLRHGSIGFTNKDLKEYILTREIAGMTKSLDTKKILGELTRDADFALSIEDRKSRIRNAVISIHAGSYSSNDNFVRAYINYDSDKREESLRLACELVNSVSSALIKNNVKLTGISVVPVIPGQKSDEQFGILVKDRPAVILEVGNINVAGLFESKNKKAIASGILEGVGNAFV